MKKNLKILFIIILICTLVIPITYSYALPIADSEKNENEKQFFEISKTEFTKNEKVEMILNLDSIKYNEFTFELKSDEVIENLEIVQSDEVEAEKNNNEIVMEINKAETNVKTINLFYLIPESKEVGDTIKFIATITGIINSENEEISKEEIDKDESELPTEKEETGKEESKLPTEKEETNKAENKQPTEKIESKEDKIDTEINEQKQETQTIEVEIKIIEEKNDDKQEENKPQENKPDTQIPNTENNKLENQMPNTENSKQEIENAQMPNKNNVSSTPVQKIPTNNSNIQYNTMSNITISNNQTPKVTYNGSDNNYLSELTVNGYTFNRAFSKENTTYFITVGNEIEKLDITAKVDDDESTVTIYGNENLKEGTNKILIAVTAENGNVRNYRIYVTKNS